MSKHIKALVKEVVKSELNAFLQERKKHLDFKKFLQLPGDGVSKLIWLERNATIIGYGGSRYVFLIDSSKVIKFSPYKYGKEQNRYETKLSLSNTSKEVITKVYKYAPDFSWIISELVRPLKSEKEFKEKIGLPIKPFLSLFKTKDVDRKIVLLQKAFEIIGEKINPEKIKQNVERFEDFLLNQKIEFEDLYNPSQWGVNSNGNVILLDYGIEEFNKY